MRILSFILLLCPAVLAAADWEEKARQEAYRPGFTQSDPSPRRNLAAEAIAAPRPAPRTVPAACQGLPADRPFDGTPLDGPRHRNDASIQRTMERNMAALNAIFQRAYREQGCMGGVVVLTISIGALGNVTEVGHWVGNPGMESIAPKIAARTRAINFGISSGAETVRYPLTFYPE